MTLPVAAGERHRQLDFDGAVSWASRRQRADPTIVGTLRLDLNSAPLLAQAAVVRAAVDSFADDVSPGVMSRMRASLRDVPVFGPIVGSIVDGLIGVAVAVTEDGSERTLRGSLRFARRPEPAQEPVAVALTVD